MKKKIIITHTIILFSLIIACNSTKQLYIYSDNEQIITEKTTITLKTNSNVNSIKGKIKTRGGSSMKFPKKSYEIDLIDDEKICNIPKDDDYILNANFIDKTFLRHVVSYDLFREMDKKNIAPLTQYIELFINESYQGLYVIMEKLDKSTLKIETKDSLSVVFKEPHLFRTDLSNITPQIKTNFHQQTYPKIETLDKTIFLNQIRDFIITSNDTSFNRQINNIFDIKNIIDWHLLLLITNNSDGILKNFYLYKQNEETPIRISPWDYDHSFGRDGDNEININDQKIDLQRSILFAKLLRYNWYKKSLKHQWEYYNKTNLLSVEGLQKRIKNNYKKIEKKVIKNNKKWKTNNPIFYDENSSNDEVEIILKFIEKRHSYLNDYFNKLAIE